MLDDFLRQIRKHDYRLDKDDLCVIGEVVSETGAGFDQEFLESIAMHIEDFLNHLSIPPKLNDIQPGWLINIWYI